jgi:hypothetical protein
MAAVCVLAACSTSAPPAPRAHSPAELQWLDNASRLIGTLEDDVLLSAHGGANLASARRALGDQSDLYTMLVAYTLFGGCSRALANVGVPSARVSRLVDTLAAACRRLERASALFERAVKRNDPSILLTATRVVLETEPLLDEAKAQLSGVT